MEDLLIGFLSKTLNQSSEEIGKLLFKKAEKDGEKTLNKEALNVLTNLDTERVKGIKASVKIDPEREKELRNEGHGRGTKEALDKLEKEIKNLQQKRDVEFNFSRRYDTTIKIRDLQDTLLRLKYDN